MIKNVIVSLALIFIVTAEGNTQTNFVVGFNAGSTLSSNNNNVLQAYNNLNSNLTEEFKNLNFLFGLEIGLSYRTGLTAMTLMYQNSRRRRAAKGIIEEDIVFNTSLNYIMSSYSLGFEAGPKNLNVGITLGSRNVNIKSKIGNSSDFKTLDKQRNLVSKIYVNIGTRGNENSSLAIRPYIEYAWGATDISNVNSTLTNINTTVKDKFHMIGISMIFYNGRH